MPIYRITINNANVNIMLLIKSIVKNKHEIK